MEKFDVVAVRKGVSEKKENWITEEVPLTIEVNGKELATLLATPGDLKDLAVGFLFTVGLIQGIDSVTSVVIDQERWKASVLIPKEGLPEEMVFKRIYTSGCGKGIFFHNPFDLIQRAEIPSCFAIEGRRIAGIMKTFLIGSPEYRETGGVHSAALADR